MRIRSVDTVTLKIPFSDLYDGPRAKRRGWTEFDTLLVRIETEDGLVGWGEAFAYGCASAVGAMIRDSVAPLVVGQEIGNVAAFTLKLQQDLHIWGRYGITIFAISGIDIALWDLAAKQAGQNLAVHLGGRVREEITAYASLVRYGGAEPIAVMTRRAVDEGFCDIKLHEIAYEPIAAARAAIGKDIRLTTDVNCAWSLAEAEAMLPRMRALDLYWVEEPTFPPEDYETHKALARFGVALSAGENACTAVEFVRLSAALTFPQPSVIKVGGVSEFIKATRQAATLGRTVMPHSPYFGPGYWATLQLAAHLQPVGLFEYMYVKPDAYCGLDIPLPQDGRITIPDTPGIGFAPDDNTLQRYRVA
jgi:L-alanine-DL-glutamate epimerase-like enolase superfamily enzyme